MARGVSRKRSGRLAFIAALIVAVIMAGSFSTYAWNYRYDSVNDIGVWSNNGIDRFKYNYSGQRWWDNSQYGGWAPLGPVGWCPVAVGEANPANFIGNGAWRSQGNGWSYLYSTAGDYGTWQYNGLHRFFYNYTIGQWYDHASSNASYWSTLGGVNTGSLFVGNGAWRSQGNGWAYLYSAAGDYGTWHIGGLHRFLYMYTAGQWSDHASSNGATYWNALGGANVGSVFVGDGNWHDVNNNGWNYLYYPGDYGTWHRGGLHRFLYHYTTGQWSDHAPNNSIYWNALSGINASSAFIGDGVSHEVIIPNGNAWLYRYDATGDEAIWADDLADRFTYQYSGGQWWNYDYNGDDNLLGAAGIGSQFVGDGAVTPHNLGNGWGYRYAAGTIDEYYLAGLRRFTYDASTGVWTDYARMGLPQQLGVAGLAGAFVGDGSAHDLGTGFNYLFDGSYGYWLLGSANKFAYLYEAGQWFDYDTYGNRFALGITGLSAEFIGNGSDHEIGNGWTYSYTSPVGTWSLGAVSFGYDYATGTWTHRSPWNVLFHQLSSTGQSAQFVADGGSHSLGNGWAYRFDGTAGIWIGGFGKTFSYRYSDGQWFDWDKFGSVVPIGWDFNSPVFIGDGSTHQMYTNWCYSYVGGELQEGNWYRADTLQLRFMYKYQYGYWEHIDSAGARDGLGTLIANGPLTLGLFDNAWHIGLGNVSYKYDYANDEILFGAALYSPTTGILKYNYATQVWSDHDLRGGSYDLWYSIGTPTGDPAIQKTWFDSSLGFRTFGTSGFRALFALNSEFPYATYMSPISDVRSIYYYGGYAGYFMVSGSPGTLTYGYLWPGRWILGGLAQTYSETPDAHRVW